jgi:uncharacterized OB-fold protein
MNMSTAKERTLPSPPMNAEAEPFYAAAREGRFMLKRCADCGKTHWYPRAVCPHCFSSATEWVQGSGRGVIYAFSPMRRVDPPYTLAYVTLAEGPTMMTNLVDCDVDALAIGQSVKLVFKPSEDGTPVPCFTPV